MTKAQFDQFNEVAMTPAVSLLAEACLNYLDEINHNELHSERAEEALRLAMDVCRRYLDLKDDLLTS